MFCCQRCSQPFVNPYKWKIKHCLECGQDFTWEELEQIECQEKGIDYATHLQQPIYTEEQIKMWESLANDPDFTPKQQQHFRELIAGSMDYLARETQRRMTILKQIAKG